MAEETQTLLTPEGPPLDPDPPLATDAELAANDEAAHARTQARLLDLTLPNQVRELLVQELGEIRERMRFRGAALPEVEPSVSREYPRGKEAMGIRVHLDPDFFPANSWKPKP